jgi:carboxypeptidase PM20D1
MKRALAFIAVGLLILASVLVIRATGFVSKQVQVAPVPPVALDADALIARLAPALRFQTVSYQDPTLLKREEFLGLQRYLAEQFPLVHARLHREVINDYSLLYTWAGTEPARKAIMLLSHQDVVPVEPGTERDWTYPPFEGRIAENYIWGRGTMDDKFGVLAILEAAEKLLHDGFQPRATLYLAFGHDEEIGGDNGAKEMAALLSRRGVEAEYVLDEGGVITHGLLPGFPIPVAVIGVAEKGNVSLELKVHAPGGHSSSPPPQTAVGIVSAAVHQLETHPLPGGVRGAAHQFLEFAGPEMPFMYRVLLANLWLFGGVIERQLASSPAGNATLRTTTAATIIEGGVKENVLPTMARAVVNFRILPGDTVQSVTEFVRRTVDDPRVDIEPLAGSREPSDESPVDSAAFTLLARTIRQTFPGTVVAPYLTIGGTDSRHYGALTRNIYRFTPILADATDLVRIHGTNERMAVANYAQCVQFFLQLITNSAA